MFSSDYRHDCGVSTFLVIVVYTIRVFHNYQNANARSGNIMEKHEYF